MSGSDGKRQVKVDMNGKTVLSVAVASPYSGDKVKEALKSGYKDVRQVYALSWSVINQKQRSFNGIYSESGRSTCQCITAAQFFFQK